MVGITHREFRTWQAWKKDQWNNPGLSEYYMMQLTGYVANMLNKRQWNIKQYKIPITIGKPSTKKIAQGVATAKANWAARSNTPLQGL